jgi:hypothetical protein
VRCQSRLEKPGRLGTALSPACAPAFASPAGGPCRDATCRERSSWHEAGVATRPVWARTAGGSQARAHPRAQATVGLRVATARSACKCPRPPRPHKRLSAWASPGPVPSFLTWDRGHGRRMLPAAKTLPDAGTRRACRLRPCPALPPAGIAAIRCPCFARAAAFWARSSAVEHYLDMVGVTGSIPVAPTISGRLRDTGL